MVNRIEHRADDVSSEVEHDAISSTDAGLVCPAKTAALSLG